jgi:hypothetical protein
MRRFAGARGAYPGRMGRIVLTILGVILAIWVALAAVGWISAMLKAFAIIGVIAFVAFLVVSLLARRHRQP